MNLSASTILWTIYMIVALYYTIICLTGIISDIRNNQFGENVKDMAYHFTIGMLAFFWVIWYMYFLH